MTERASDLLSELSERLTADLQDAGATASEAIRTSMPELDLTVPESFSEMPIRSSSQFLEALYRPLRIDSSVPWAQYYILAREASHRYAERSEEHTSELQSRGHLVCRLLLEKKK